MKKLVNDVQWLHFTNNHTGKMEDLVSLSTSNHENARCDMYKNIPGAVCGGCFADKIENRYDALSVALMNNGYALKFSVIDWDMIPRLNVAYFRIEAFGDIETQEQAYNYYQLIKKNPHTRFAWFTKNADIMGQLFKEFEKPENVTIIYSSILLNKPSRIGAWWCDHVFTVYTKEYINAHPEIIINCGALHCFTCGKCYNGQYKEKYINELLK